MSQWIDGPPPDDVPDGLYSLQLWSLGFVHARREAGKWMNPELSALAGSVPSSTIRHFRLPDIPAPLEPPRRFRAKRNGKPVIGVEVDKDSVDTPLLIVAPPHLACVWTAKGTLADFEWIDRGKDAQ